MPHNNAIHSLQERNQTVLVIMDDHNSIRILLNAARSPQEIALSINQGKGAGSVSLPPGRHPWRALVIANTVIISRQIPALLLAWQEMNACQYRLGARRQQVWTYLQRGLSTKEIAGKMGISQRAVRYHLRSIQEQVDEMKLSGGARLVKLFPLASHSGDEDG